MAALQELRCFHFPMWRRVRNPRLQGPAEVAWLKEEFARRRGGQGRCSEIVTDSCCCFRLQVRRSIVVNKPNVWRCVVNQFKTFVHPQVVGRISPFFHGVWPLMLWNRWSHELWSAAYRLGRWPYRCCHGRFTGAATTTLCVTWQMCFDRLNGKADAVVCFCDVNFSSEHG